MQNVHDSRGRGARTRRGGRNLVHAKVIHGYLVTVTMRMLPIVFLMVFLDINSQLLRRMWFIY